jgi:hypothetical protein
VPLERSLDYFPCARGDSELIADVDFSQNRKPIAHLIDPLNVGDDVVRFELDPAHLQCAV